MPWYWQQNDAVGDRAVRWRLTGCLVWLAVLTAGCGTTRMSDTVRTGTEQLLLSAAVDEAINQINFEPLKGQAVFLDQSYLKGVVDENYIASSLRQHMLAHGCQVKEQRFDADFIVEARAGAVGTNRHDVLLGVPSVSLPNTGLPGVPSNIPEIPFAKSTDQRGVAKIAVFAYHRESGQPVWQSGAFPVSTSSKDTWILGSGPFQRGTIYDGTRFAGSRILLPFAKPKPSPNEQPAIPVTAEAVFIHDAPPSSTARAPATNQTSAASASPSEEATSATSAASLPSGRQADTQSAPTTSQVMPASVYLPISPPGPAPGGSGESPGAFSPLPPQR